MSDEDRPDPVIERYKRDVDRSLLRANLRLTVEERLLRGEAGRKAMAELRGKARRVPPEGEP